MIGVIEIVVQLAIWLILACLAISLVVKTVSMLYEQFRERSDTWELTLLNRVGSAEWDIKQLAVKLDAFVNDTKRCAAQDSLECLAANQRDQEERLRILTASLGDLQDQQKIYKRLMEQSDAVMTGIDERQDFLRQEFVNFLMLTQMAPGVLERLRNDWSSRIGGRDGGAPGGGLPAAK